MLSLCLYLINSKTTRTNFDENVRDCFKRYRVNKKNSSNYVRKYIKFYIKTTTGELPISIESSNQFTK
jgi:hypothetical protein